MNINHKIKILTSIIFVLTSLILIIIFGIKIEIIRSNIVISDGTSQIVLTNIKIHKYLQKQPETKTYLIKDINKTIDVKCSLIFSHKVDDNYSYYCILLDGSQLSQGIYNTNINFGQVIMYEYFVYFN